MSEAGGQGLSRRHQGQPEQPEHGPRPAHPAEPALPAGRARHRGRAAASPARSTRDEAMKEIDDGWNEITDEIGKDEPAARGLQGDASASSANIGLERAPRPDCHSVARTPGRAWHASRPERARRARGWRPSGRLGTGGVHPAGGLVVLALSIFPLIVSLYLSLSRFKLAQGRLHGRLHRPRSIPEAAVRLAAVPPPRHARRRSPRSAGRS